MPRTTVYDEADPFKNDTPENSIGKPAFPKGLAGCPNSKRFNGISFTIRSWSCRWTISTRSSSRVLPNPNKSCSSKWVSTTTGVTLSQVSWARGIFASSAKRVSTTTATDTTPAKVRNVPLVTKPSVRIVDPGSRSTIPAAVVIGSSSGNSVSPTTRRTRPPTGKKPTPPKRSKACVGPPRNAPNAIDFFENARSRGGTSAGRPNAPRAKNTEISTSTSVSSRIPPSWNRNGNY